MIIAIRKELNGSLYIDKNIYNDDRFANIDLSQSPYNYSKVELDEIYLDCISEDFNDDLTFSIEKYNARKQKENAQLYVDKIVAKIRLRYSLNDELAILRQALAKPEEFAEYNAYVEQCKAEVKSEYNI